MNKILVVCGPTATGKTDLGIYLGLKFSGEIISADSRQVYKNMDIGTGKEYSDKVNIWGYDLVNINEEFSVSHFQALAHAKISELIAHNKLPVVVGGTGLYIRSIVENMAKASIPKDQNLRKRLEKLSRDELFITLLKVNYKKAQSMNSSDIKNPRRLIRAIEMSLNPNIEERNSRNYDVLKIGLSSDMFFLEKRLRESINKRLKMGFVNEVRDILSKNSQMHGVAMTATGYLEIAKYLKGEISKEESIKLWFTRERQYVKRQLTFFNKDKSIHWFDIMEPNYKVLVEEFVKKWHNEL